MTTTEPAGLPARMTIVDRLEEAASGGGGKVVFHLDDGTVAIDARELYDMARIRAARLRDAGVGPGQRVGIVGPNRPDWLAWGHAAWMRGAAIVGLPIPLRVRQRDALAHQINSLAAGFGCTRVATHERFAPLIDHDLLIEWDDVGSIDDAVPPSELIRLDDDTPARITPTSGSTATPKGVSRSYRNQNQPQMVAWMKRLGGPEPRHLTYGPLSHALPSLALFAFFEPGLEIHMLVPERFARDPGELFRIVGPNGITQMTGASSTYAAALRSIERRPDGVDLSPLRDVTFSYEMIDPDIVARLYDTGARFGLDPLAVRAYYGLAEGGGTRTPAGQRVRVDEVDLEALVTDRVARPAAASGGALVKRVVSCGVENQCEMRIAGPDGAVLPERHVGEVQFAGTGLMQGYVGPGAHDAFTSDGWMVTGDAGYLADGELFITGRMKEVIVQQGKKYHPEDVEWAAARGAGVPPDACVAFVPVDGGDGDIVLAIEIDGAVDLNAVEQGVRAAVMNAVGVSLKTVSFVPVGSLPKASSGKSQRIAARDRHAEGILALNDRE